MTYKPPFELSPNILKLLQKAWQQIGILEGQKLDQPSLELRKSNNIKTIQASLAIEGNTLSINQVTDIFEGKRVLGPPKDILEVKNALKIYESFTNLKVYSSEDILKAHKILMEGLNKQAGQWRTENVAIFKEKEITHLPPPSYKVSHLMNQLFSFLEKDKDIPLLVKACVFHYELEFIHPFMDGNGRIGRLWQQRVLMEENRLFQYISIEELIKHKQREYYRVLGECDQEGNSTKFIEFSLDLIVEALNKYTSEATPQIKTPQERLEYAFLKIGRKFFTRKDYLSIHKNISTATASRDIIFGLKNKTIMKKGEKNQTLYFFD